MQDVILRCEPSSASLEGWAAFCVAYLIGGAYWMPPALQS
jgi:hypothetical protein